jgi:hypothetical protein
MSNTNDPTVQSFGTNTYAGSTNAGQYAAQNNVPLAPQQYNESADAYGNRSSAYHSEKNKN